MLTGIFSPITQCYFLPSYTEGKAKGPRKGKRNSSESKGRQIELYSPRFESFPEDTATGEAYCRQIMHICETTSVNIILLPFIVNPIFM